MHRHRDRVVAFSAADSSRHNGGFDWSAAVDADVRRLRAQTHTALERIHRDLQKFQFNTIIAACMELVNTVERFDVGDEVSDARLDFRAAALHEALVTVIKVLSPIVPHIAHGLWGALELDGAVIDASWPDVDPRAVVRDTVEMVVQVDGKLRGHIEVASEADETIIQQTALSEERVRRHVGDKPVKKIIVVPGKLVNIVLAGR